MYRLGLMVKPGSGSVWRKRLLELPGMEWRLVFHHPPSGKSVEVYLWFCQRGWVARRCRELGISLVGCGDWAPPSGTKGDLQANRGYAALVNSLVDRWREAMRERGISPARARVVVAGDDWLGVLCAQALAEETACLTLTGRLCSKLEPLLHRALYETGVPIKLEERLSRAGEEADAIILAGTDEDLPHGEHFRGVWFCRLPGTSPLMVSLPGKVTTAGGAVRGLISRFFSRAWPGWVKGLLGNLSEADFLTVPADYCESLLMALEGGDIIGRYGQRDRLEYLHQVKLLGINYQSATAKLDFP
ncbi:MAG: hypothetical protein HPY50_17585 [Firmicutes bacterium]|nr:hypothetical protein [Bacillota bacterium]